MQTPRQYSLDIALPKFATFETYIDTSKGSLLPALKKMLASTLAGDAEPQQYFLWGGTCTGKTHLLQAMCNQAASQKQNAIYLPMKQLADQPAEILNDMHHLDLLCIDDIETILGDMHWDKQLFILINELRANNKSIVFTSKLKPNQIQVSFPDLSSRLVWGPVYKLKMLVDDKKAQAIQAHAKARGLDITSEVCSYMLKRFPRELDRLIDVLDELDEQSLVHQRKVTIPFVKTVLSIN